MGYKGRACMAVGRVLIDRKIVYSILQSLFTNNQSLCFWGRSWSVWGRSFCPTYPTAYLSIPLIFYAVGMQKSIPDSYHNVLCSILTCKRAQNGHEPKASHPDSRRSTRCFASSGESAHARTIWHFEYLINEKRMMTTQTVKQPMKILRVR